MPISTAAPPKSRPWSTRWVSKFEVKPLPRPASILIGNLVQPSLQRILSGCILVHKSDHAFVLKTKIYILFAWTLLQLLSSTRHARFDLRFLYCWATDKDLHVTLRSAIILRDNPDHQESQYGELWVEPDFLSTHQVLLSLWRRLPSPDHFPRRRYHPSWYSSNLLPKYPCPQLLPLPNDSMDVDIWQNYSRRGSCYPLNL